MHRIQCNNPRVVNQFNVIYHQFSQENKIDSRVFNLQTQIQKDKWE